MRFRNSSDMRGRVWQVEEIFHHSMIGYKQQGSIKALMKLGV